MKEWELNYPQYQLSSDTYAIYDHLPLFLKKIKVDN